jgi:hypothetical protein
MRLTHGIWQAKSLGFSPGSAGIPACRIADILVGGRWPAKALPIIFADASLRNSELQPEQSKFH